MPKQEECDDLIMTLPQILPNNDFMTRSRIIYFNSDFTSNAAKSVIERLLIMNAESIDDDITLIIDSLGGDVSSFLAIYDTINSLVHCNVATVCLGSAMSCGQMLLMSGTKGKRFITQNSKVLVHQLSSGTCGKLSDMENHVNYVSDLDKTIKRLILKHTRIKPKELNVMMTKDTYLNADAAVKYGICDHVITKPSDFYAKLCTKNSKAKNIIDDLARSSRVKKLVPKDKKTKENQEREV